jgi:hypothetical protein
MHCTITLKGIVVIKAIIHFLLINMPIQQSSGQSKAQNISKITKQIQWTHKNHKILSFNNSLGQQII